MSDMGTRQAAEKWGYTAATVSRWCRDGLIPNATQDKSGSAWHIPIDAECPKKNRKKKKRNCDEAITKIEEEN